MLLSIHDRRRFERINMNDPQHGWTNPIPLQASKPAISIPTHIQERLKLAHLSVDKDGLLMLWESIKKTLAVFKDDEMELRKLAVEFLKTDIEEPKTGVNNVDLGGGYTAKVGLKLNYKLEGNNEQIESILDKIETCGNEGKFIAERLVRWKADLSVTEYKDLQEQAKSSAVSKQILTILNEIVVTDDGAPTLDIKEPRKGKKE